jgi:hypothetical protein
MKEEQKIIYLKKKVFQKRREEEVREETRRKEGSLTLMKRTINSPTVFSPVEKEKRTTSPTMHQTSSQSSLISTSSSVRRELDRALAFKKPPNGPMRDGITVDILKIDENDFKGTISPIEAKNLIYINTLGLDSGLYISFKGHPVITYRL